MNYSDMNENATFILKITRNIEIIYEGAVYEIEIITKPTGIKSTVTEFWINRKNYSLKYLAEVVKKPMEDKECAEKIRMELEYWISDMDSLIG